MSETLVNKLDKLVEDSNIYNKGQAKTQKELNEENEVLRNCIESELEDVTVEGTEITVDDAAEYYASVVPKGDTKQTSYTGVQLFDENILSQESDYNAYDSATQLWTTNSGGGYGRSILYNATGYANRNIEKLVPLTSAGTYTLKFYDFVNDTGYASAIELALFDNDGLKISQTTQNGNFIKFTIDNSCYMDLCRRNNSGTMSFSKIMMVKGDYTEDTFPDYEPYVGGVLSPNSDYPQPIHVVSGENTIEVNSKNFYDATQKRQTKNRITFSADNQYIYMNGKASAEFNCDFKHTRLRKGTYTLSMQLVSGSISSTAAQKGLLIYVAGEYSSGYMVISSNSQKLKATFTLKQDGYIYIHMWPRGSENIENAQIAYQIVKENVADYEFVPYYHNEYQLNLNQIKMVSIGSHKDQFKIQDGNWIIPNKVQEIDSYNGETITTEYISTTGGLDEGATIYYVGTEDYVVEDKTLIEQLDELNKILTNYGTNHIYTVIDDTENLNPVLELTYKKSNAIKFQKEINELKAMVLDNS